VVFPDSRPLTGTWSGSYTCGQGPTGLTLEITGNTFGAVAAVFAFYELPENQGVPDGRFAMRGFYEFTGALRLNADETDWIVKPDGYQTVDLEGVVTDDLTSFSGNVLPQVFCATFSVTRQ
jgi:hypothetical protein